jgi:hypothetical protein
MKGVRRDETVVSFRLFSHTAPTTMRKRLGLPGSPRALCSLSVFILFLQLFAPHVRAEDRLSQYLYEDTKQLVRLVEDAAALLQRNGTTAFAEYRRQGSRWLNEKYYFFVYDGNGTCVFHAVSPDLVGKNLLDFRDMHGKPVIRYITDIGRQPEPDAHGWVFYLWPDKDGLMPKWKSAYVRKVVAPDGNLYLIGSGIYDFKMERVFVQRNVQRAAEMLVKEGKESAFRAFRDLASPFNFLDTSLLSG